MSRKKIGVIIPDVYDPLDREFLTGVQTANNIIGFDTLVFTGISSENTDSYISGENNIYELPFASGMDGIIIASNRFHDKELKEKIYHRIEKSGIPSVAAEEEYGGIKGVFFDQRKCIFDITEHLIKYHGYRNIICLTGPAGNREAEERAAGFADAMESFGLDFSDRIIYGDFWRESAFLLSEKIAAGEIERPRAVVCTNDIMAINLCQSLQNYGIKVPDDIAVTGYDGSLYTLLTKPAITTVCGGDRCLGMLAVKKLCCQLGVVSDLDCGSPKIRTGGSCGCKNEAAEKEYLLKYTEKILHKQLEHKSFMFSNYIAKMSDCESIPKFAAALDGLGYMLSDCRVINVCLCEDWRTEIPEYRKSGFSENMELIYSKNQPGQLRFPLTSLLPCLNIPHEPQFWVFTSLHYSDRIIGYIASNYEKAEFFTADEHYINWCDAVANGLDIVIKKGNTLYIWQKLEEKNLTDIYTGLLSKKGFISKLKKGDKTLVFAFPDKYADMQYFIPIVSAVLRSEDGSKTAAYLGETVFGAVTDVENNNIIAKMCRSLSELGMYVTEDELQIAHGIIDGTRTAEEQLAEMYNKVGENNSRKNSKNSEAYFKIFSDLRNEMRYFPNADRNIQSAAAKVGLSGSHFQRLYKKYFGIPFTEELIFFRLERAKYLLKNTAMPVRDIAEECGYANTAHFMRQFKLRFGISAGQYRKGEESAK